MTQAAVERALGKLVTDEAFRDRFFEEPTVATSDAGLTVSRAELDALVHLSKKALAQFRRLLDDRICQVSLDGEERPDPSCGPVPGAGRSPAEARAAINAARRGRKQRAG